MTNEQYLVSIQQNQERYVRIELLNSAERVIDTIEGIVISGDININADSLIRRTCNLTIYLKDNSYVPVSSTSKLWMDKKFRLKVGIKDILTDEYVWFDKGIYLLNKPSLKYSTTERTLSIQGLDKFCNLDGTFSGSLQYITKIPANTPLFDAVKATYQLSGDNKFIINDTEGFVVPYEITKNEDENISDMLTELRDLFMGFEMFYNEDGWFVFQRIKDRKYDPVMWEFTDGKFIIDYTSEPDWENVKNDIYVWGKQKEDSLQVSYHIQNNDSNNPFSIDKIGVRKFTDSDDKLFTAQQAQVKAEYLKWKHSSLNEKISLTGIPLYGLDVNNLVYVKNDEIGVDGNYLITSISLPIDVSGTMTLGGYKLYY